MARPRTATNILHLRGAFKKHPERKKVRKHEPVSKGSFPKQPPKFLGATEKKCWREIVKRVPAGVLGGSDVFTVELAARLLAEMRDTGREMAVCKLTRLSTELGKLGLSPSDRAKLQVEKNKAGKFDNV